MLQLTHTVLLIFPFPTSYLHNVGNLVNLEKNPEKELILLFDILSLFSSTRNEVGRTPGWVCTCLVKRKWMQFIRRE